MKKAKNTKVNMKTLATKITRVNKDLDIICDMLAELKAEKKAPKAKAKTKKKKAKK